jgi:hypothetical protein
VVKWLVLESSVGVWSSANNESLGHVRNYNIKMCVMN